MQPLAGSRTLVFRPRMLQRINYYRRIFSAYLGGGVSQLTFWHDVPEVNSELRPNELVEYYMPFTGKANYQGPHDSSGIPMLNYRGAIGLQYNPIAIAQYGLGNYTLYRRTGDPDKRIKFLRVANWMADNLERNHANLWFWMHKFDWEYRQTLKKPWYSALAQGQGISLLVRAHQDTGESRYLEAAHRAFASFKVGISDGGVTYIDLSGNTWFEEYIVWPPTHILNGFIWASWGVYDYALATKDGTALDLFDRAVRTLNSVLPSFDTGFWSLYEHSGTLLPTLASKFYHLLHIVQLRVMFKLTGNPQFARFADQWESYSNSSWNQTRALASKALFKLLYY
jgi:heparosan-N-sulfate-glucuronate 5-epimerase